MLLLALALFVAVHYVSWRGVPYPVQTARETADVLTEIGRTLDLHHTLNTIYPPGRPFAGLLTAPDGFPQLIRDATPRIDPVDLCLRRWHEAVAPDLTVSVVAVIGLGLWWLAIARGTRRGQRTLSLRECGAVTLIFAILAALPLPVGLSLGIPFSALGALAIAQAVRKPETMRAHSRRLLLTLAAGVILITQAMLLAHLAGTQLSHATLALMGNRADYHYATDGQRFYLLQSVGPDLDRDLDITGILDVAGLIEAETRIRQLQYDPKQGALGPGDIFHYRIAPQQP